MKRRLVWAFMALPLFAACDSDDKINIDDENESYVEVTMQNIADTWYYTYTDKPAKGGIAAMLLDEGPNAYSFASGYIQGFCGIPLLPSKIEFQAKGSTERRVEYTFNYETDADGYVTSMTYFQRTLGFEPTFTFTY